MTYISYWEILLRLGLATVLGILFGFERNKSSKPVGIRTHILICLTACVVALISSYGFVDYEVRVAQALGQSIDVRSDPARLVVGVLTVWALWCWYYLENTIRECPWNHNSCRNFFIGRIGDWHWDGNVFSCWRCYGYCYYQHGADTILERYRKRKDEKLSNDLHNSNKM